MNLRTTIVGVAALAVCVTLAPHAYAAEPTPWTHRGYDDRDQDFTFAVISDLNGGERQGIFDVAVADLNKLRPALVMSVGDLISGNTENPQKIEQQWDNFDRRARQLIAPFFYVVGNHDIGNAVMQRIWEERLGRRYYHFVYKGVLFLALDSEDYDPNDPGSFKFETLTDEQRRQQSEAIDAYEKHGDEVMIRRFAATLDWDGSMPGAISDEQVAYFKRAIAENPDVRWTFLFLHKPFWQGDGNAGYRQIEAALGDRPFTAFSGHTHNYKFFGGGRKTRIRLGTTGGFWVHESTTNNFDHVVLVSIREGQPSIVNLRLDGILDETGRIPGGADLCFSEDACLERKAKQSAQQQK